MNNDLYYLTFFSVSAVRKELTDKKTMSFSSFRGIIFTLLVLAGLWVLFLIAAHLILDFEQGRLYFESLSFTQIGNTRQGSIDDTLYFERTEGKTPLYLKILSLIEHNNYIIFNARPVLFALIKPCYRRKSFLSNLIIFISRILK